jgi:hypothetical protein
VRTNVIGLNITNHDLVSDLHAEVEVGIVVANAKLATGILRTFCCTVKDVNAIALFNKSKQTIDFKSGNSLGISAVLKS